MNIDDINNNIAELMETKDAEDINAIKTITNSFEIAILHGIVNGKTIDLEHIGQFSNEGGAIVFKPSLFLTSAAQCVRK